MKKVLLFILVFSFIYSCKYSETGYSFSREYDNGTYLTSKNVAKYISGKPDTAIVVRDVYAILQEEIMYSDNAKDSILIYGHCWSTLSTPTVIDSMSTRFFDDNNGDEVPDAFVDTLMIGSKFTSILGNLAPETQYYARSYVISGKFVNGEPVYTDTAFNPIVYAFETDEPKDVWEIRAEFDGGEMRGALAFTHDDKLYMGMGHNEFGISNDIYQYDPQTDVWSLVTTYPHSATKVSNAVAFVIKNVKVGYGVYHDYAYIGTGFSVVGTDTTVNKEFWRWDFADEWVRLDDGSQFGGFPLQNAVAFSINGLGYVLLGTGGNGVALNEVWKFDPEEIDENHILGTWVKINKFLPGSRTKAVAFVIDESAFVSGGVDDNGTYKKDLYMFRQTVDGNGAWAKKKDFPGTARIDAVSFSLESMGYIGTGWDGDSLRTDFWRYNPYVNEWDQRAYFGGAARSEAFGVGVKYSENDYRGYVGTGRGLTNADFYSDFWHYRP